MIFVNNLDEISSVNEEDLLHIRTDSNVDNKITIANFKADQIRKTENLNLSVNTDQSLGAYTSDTLINVTPSANVVLTLTGTLTKGLTVYIVNNSATYTLTIDGYVLQNTGNKLRYVKVVNVNNTNFVIPEYTDEIQKAVSFTTSITSPIVSATTSLTSPVINATTIQKTGKLTLSGSTEIEMNTATLDINSTTNSITSTGDTTLTTTGPTGRVVLNGGRIILEPTDDNGLFSYQHKLIISNSTGSASQYKTPTRTAFIECPKAYKINSGSSSYVLINKNYFSSIVLLWQIMNCTYRYISSTTNMLQTNTCNVEFSGSYLKFYTPEFSGEDNDIYITFQYNEGTSLT